MSNVLNWFFAKSKSAKPETSEQIRAHLHAGEKTQAAIEQRITAAKERLRERDPKANAELQAAKAELDELAGPLEILREELTESLAREEAEERQRKRVRRDELVPRLRYAGVLERLAPLLACEIDLTQKLARARLDRRELHVEMSTELREYTSLCQALGEPAALDHRIEYCVSSLVTTEALDAIIAKLDGADPMRRLLQALRPDVGDYEVGNVHAHRPGAQA